MSLLLCCESGRRSEGQTLTWQLLTDALLESPSPLDAADENFECEVCEGKCSETCCFENARAKVFDTLLDSEETERERTMLVEKIDDILRERDGVENEEENVPKDEACEEESDRFWELSACQSGIDGTYRAKEIPKANDVVKLL